MVATPKTPRHPATNVSSSFTAPGEAKSISPTVENSRNVRFDASRDVKDLDQDPHSQSKGRHSSAIDELKDSVQVKLAAFRRALREEASKELADFQQALTRDAYKEANALSTRLKNVESELETTKTQLDEACSETAAVESEFHTYREQHRKALKNYTKLIRAEINELGVSVSAILNRDALEKESDCVEAYAKFMWNTLRDAIPQTPELLSGASELDHPDQSSLSPQPATPHDGDRHGVFDSSYDDDAIWVRSTRKDTGHWAVPPEWHDAYLEATARIVTADLPIDARTRVSTRARDHRLHHDRHRVHLNNLNIERPLLFSHLAEGGAMNLFYHDLHTQHRLTDLRDPITLLDYLLRLERVGEYNYRTRDDLHRSPRAARVREILAAMGPEYATKAIFALKGDPASPHIPLKQLQSLQDYFGDRYHILIKGEDVGWTPKDPEIELCG